MGLNVIMPTIEEIINLYLRVIDILLLTAKFRYQNSLIAR